MLASVLFAATAFVGGRVLPVSGPPIERGVLVIDGAKIVAVGPEGSTAIPPGAVRVDVSGKTIVPGLVDTHSHVGGVAGADGSSPIQPDVSVGDSVDPFDPGFRRVVAGGITTMNVMPGSGHLLSGKTVYLKPKPSKTLDGMLIRDAKGNALGGLKMANGTNPQRENPPFPGTRGKSAALVRERFVAAQEYRDRIARAKGDPDKMPPRDLGLETLVEVLEGKRVVHHHTHRADDILTVLRLQKEFGFKVVLQHAVEAWKVTDAIRASGAGCSAILVDSPGGKLETRDVNLASGRILEEAGILTAFHTDDWITDSRFFFRMGALGVRYGMSREGALAALTVAGAKLLDLDARVGSLEKGKDADFVILSGDPFSAKTEVLETWIEGSKVFDRSVPADRLYAEGGYGAGNPTRPYLCCAEGVSQ